jgi:hypothetical protein
MWHLTLRFPIQEVMDSKWLPPVLTQAVRGFHNLEINAGTIHESRLLKLRSVSMAINSSLPSNHNTRT